MICIYVQLQINHPLGRSVLFRGIGDWSSCCSKRGNTRTSLSYWKTRRGHQLSLKMLTLFSQVHWIFNHLSYHVLKMGKGMIKWLDFHADWGCEIKYLLTDRSRNEIASSAQRKIMGGVENDMNKEINGSNKWTECLGIREGQAHPIFYSILSISKTAV